MRRQATNDFILQFLLSSESGDNQTSSARNATATFIASQGGQRIAAVDERAQAASVVPGLSLADARALAPGLATIAALVAGVLQLYFGRKVFKARHRPNRHWSRPPPGDPFYDRTELHFTDGTTRVIRRRGRATATRGGDAR